VSSQHSATVRNFRPDEDEYAPAMGELDSRGRHMTDYLRACLRWLKADPDAALAALAPHWPPPRRYGRPHAPHRTPPSGPGGGQYSEQDQDTSDRKNARLG
jgi:hypothetical protein